MRISIHLETLLIQQKNNIAYFEIQKSGHPFLIQKHKKFTLVSNLNHQCFHPNSFFNQILSICFNLGLNVNSYLPFPVLNQLLQDSAPIITLGQFEHFLKSHIQDLIFDLNQDLICLSLKEQANY